MLKNSITKADYEALPEAVRAFYKEGGDGAYTLLHDGREKAKELLDAKDQKLSAKDRELAQERERRAALEKALEGIDPEKAREALRKLEELDTKELIAKGDVEKALENERKKYQTKLDEQVKRFDSERAFTKSVLIDDALRRVLTGGRDSEGKEIPSVRKGLVDAAMALLKTTHSPDVIEEGPSRKAVIKVNGIDRDLREWLEKEWLASDAAKDFTGAPESSGGHGNGTRPAGLPAATKTVSRGDSAAVNANIEAIAKGEARLVD